MPFPPRATHRGHVWTYDFVFDRTEDTRPLKLLVVLDEYTRECHRIRVGRGMDSRVVLQTLQAPFTPHGHRSISGATTAGSSSPDE